MISGLRPQNHPKVGRQAGRRAAKLRPNIGETLMKRIVLRFGLASGAVLLAMSAVILPLCMNGTLNFDNSELVGYTAMIIAFLFVFFGVKSYRDNVAAGSITFGRAFKV